MAIHRFAVLVYLAILVQDSLSAPTRLSTVDSTEILDIATPTTSPEFITEEKSKSSVITEVVTTTQAEGIFATSTANELNTDKEASRATEISTIVTTLENKTEESVKNVSSSSKVTNTTTVDKDDGPSSILYPVCIGYLGVHNKESIKDDQMFASSSLDAEDLMKLINDSLNSLESNFNKNSTQVKSNYTITGNMTEAHHGRLGNTEGSWCASGDPFEGEHHLVVDLGQITILEGVVTQGRSDSDNWVTEYTVSHSIDKNKWSNVRKDGEQMIFQGNKDRDSSVVRNFPHRIAARYIMFNPRKFHGKLVCMRVEAIGCHPDAVNVAKNQPTTQSSIENNSTIPLAVDGQFLAHLANDTCTRTKVQSSPWLRIDLRRSYQIKQVFISNQDHKYGWDMFNFEVRVGSSLDNDGNDNPLCSALSSVHTILPGEIGSIVCQNTTMGRYVNIRVNRDNSQVSLCEVAVIGVAETVVKLGLEDIANNLKPDSVKGDDVFGCYNGQGQAGGQSGLGMDGIFGQGSGMLNNLQGQGLGMLNNLGGAGMGMANQLKGQGLAMANKLKGQALKMANEMKDKAMGMANKMKDKAMEMADKAKKQGLEMAEKAKKQALEEAEKLKKQGMEVADKAKKQGMEMADKAKEQGMAMANDLQKQGMGMVGDMQGQMNQQQDKFKEKLKEILEKAKDYMEIGKEEKDKFMEKGYIEKAKEYMDLGMKHMMKAIAFIQAKMMESLSNIAGDMTKQITTLSEYDTSDIKGLLDGVDPVPVRNFVEEAKPKIGEFIDEMEKTAKKYLEIGIEKGKEARDEIESEAESAKNDATSLGKNVAGKAQSAGMNAANKAKKVGMDAANKAKSAGMDAMNKAKEQAMGAVNKAKSQAMGAVNKAKEQAMGAVNKAKAAGMDAVNEAKSMGMGALNKAKGLGMGAFGDLKKAGMGALNQAKGLGMGALGQLKGMGQGMLGQLSKAGKELLKKAKDMKPSQIKEIQQIQMLQQIKKMKQMKELQKELELEQDIQWKEFEKLSKEMADEIELEKGTLKDGDAPGKDGNLK